MTLGIVIHSTDAETVWNAFRLGVFALKQGDTEFLTFDARQATLAKAAGLKVKP